MNKRWNKNWNPTRKIIDIWTIHRWFARRNDLYLDGIISVVNMIKYCNFQISMHFNWNFNEAVWHDSCIYTPEIKHIFNIEKIWMRKNPSFDISAPKINTIRLDDVTAQSQFLKYYLKTLRFICHHIECAYIGKWKTIIAGVMCRMRRNFIEIRP